MCILKLSFVIAFVPSVCVSSLGSSVRLGYLTEKEESKKRICPFLPIFVTTLPLSSVFSWSHAHPLCLCVCYLLSRVRLFVTPWTVAHQAPLSMEFSRQEYWSGLPFLSPGDLPNPGIRPWSPVLQGDSLPSEPPGKPSSVLLMHFSLISAQLLMDLIQGFFFFFPSIACKTFSLQTWVLYFRCSMITF